MNQAQTNDPFAVPAFATFRDLLVQNLGFFPQISYDRFGSEHRVRGFDQPILLSEFALGRHKQLLDLANVAYESRSPAYLSAGLCLLLGGDWLLSNKFPGLGLVAHAFRDQEFSAASIADPVAKLLADAAQDYVGALINLFFPIAHEIGHLPAAQAYCPSEIKTQIMSEEFLKTYEINYNRVAPVTGKFSYAESLEDSDSPLNLQTLREEIICDWFATYAIFWLIGRRRKSSTCEYPVAETIANLLHLPLLLEIEAVCLRKELSVRAIHDGILAAHCRYSVIIDSARVAPTLISSISRDGVNRIVDDLMEKMNDAYRVSWKAASDVLRIIAEIAKLDSSGIKEYVQNALPTARQQFEFGQYLSRILDDASRSILLKENRNILHWISADACITSWQGFWQEESAKGHPRG